MLEKNVPIRYPFLGLRHVKGSRDWNNAIFSACTETSWYGRAQSPLKNLFQNTWKFAENDGIFQVKKRGNLLL